MRRRFLVLPLIALTALVTVAGAALTLQDDAVATLDGSPISRDELLFQMGRLERTTSGSSSLADQALDEIRTSRATLVLAQEQGLVASTDYQDFLDEVEAENSARADAQKRGETVYGLTDFTPQEYYSHRMSEVRTQLESALSQAEGDPLWVSDDEVREAFDADRDSWSANATTYEYTELVVESKISGVEDLSDVDEPGARLTTGTYSGSSGNGVNTHDQELAAVLTTLSPGEISDPVVGTGQVTYYQLDDRTVDEDAAFETYATRIRQSLTEDKLDQLIEERVGASDFTVDSAAVDAIDAEDVQG